MIQAACNGIKCNALLDCGSSVSLVSTSFVNTLQLHNAVRPCNLKLTSFSNDNIPLLGEIDLTLVIAEQQCRHSFVVTDQLIETDILIGADLMTSHHLTISRGERTLYTQH